MSMAWHRSGARWLCLVGMLGVGLWQKKKKSLA